MMKKYFSFALLMVVTILGVVCGGGVMAIAGTNPSNQGAAIDGEAQGATNPESNHENLDGTFSQTENDRLDAANGIDRFDSRGLSNKIREILPQKTPFDQLTRHASAGEKPEGMKIEYASIGARPTTTKLKSALSISGLSADMDVDDPQIFSTDDVILIPDYKAVTDCDGNAYAAQFGNDTTAEAWPCLMVKVCGYNDSTSSPVVYALNGNGTKGNATKITSVYKKGGSSPVTSIPVGTTVIRIAKAVNEGASQTGRTAEMPATDKQFCQIFMTQTEESLIHKLTKRDVQGLDLAWGERRTLEDLRMVQEGTFLFSDMTITNQHPKENLNKMWTTRGAWYQAGKDAVLGHLDSNGNLEVNEDDLVNLNNSLFVGEGTGGKKKLLFCGSDFISALEKIKSEKFRLKGDVQAWDLTFTSWKTTFGEVLAIHDETLDKYGKSKEAFSLDPEYFEKRTLLSLDRNALDLNALGVRATEAVVLKEISAVILYSPKAHARVKLAK